ALASFAWGILSILLSPCHLSSIPLIIGYITSQGEISFRRTFSISVFFALGILLSIALIGVITFSLGRMMGDVGHTGNYIVAAVFFLMGLYLLEIIKLPWSGIGISPVRFKGLIAAFVLGLIFGIGLGPCTFAFMAPVLGVVFDTSSSGLAFPALLLLSFALGHCLVIAGAGTLSRWVQKYINWSDRSKVLNYTKKVCGILVILGGFYIIYNQ
ncbi:MAG: cytochrome c biogenesis CcdA family protein, partial [Syntrophothermus sp.]